MLLGAAHGFRADPAGLTLVVVFLVALSLSAGGTAGAAWVGIVHGWAILLRPAAAFFLLPAAAVVHTPSPSGPSAAPSGRRRWIAYLTPLLLLAVLRLPLAASLPVWDPAADRPAGSILAPVEAMFLRPAAAAPDPERSDSFLRAGSRTLLRALLLGIGIGPFFARSQKPFAAVGWRLFRAALLFLIGLAVTLTALRLAGSGGGPLPAWGLPALLVLVALSYHRSHPSDRPAGHGAIVAVLTGTALFLAGFNYL